MKATSEIEYIMFKAARAYQAWTQSANIYNIITFTYLVNAASFSVNTLSFKYELRRVSILLDNSSSSLDNMPTGSDIKELIFNEFLIS